MWIDRNSNRKYLMLWSNFISSSQYNFIELDQNTSKSWYSQLSCLTFLLIKGIV